MGKCDWLNDPFFLAFITSVLCILLYSGHKPCLCIVYISFSFFLRFMLFFFTCKHCKLYRKYHR